MKLSDLRYIVSFNNDCCGDEHQNTVDYLGNDLDTLVGEVIYDHEGRLAYRPVHDHKDVASAVGEFYEPAEDVEDQYAVAVMFDQTIATFPPNDY